MKIDSSHTVLLTGATGFIGKHLRRRLRQDFGAKLILLSRTAPGDLVAAETWIGTDLEVLSRQTWADHGVDRIDLLLHLGSFTPKASSAGDAIAEVYSSNLIGSRRLLESLPNVPERIVFSSTLDVYAPPAEGQVLTEESALGPASLYGASKLFGEHLMEFYARKSGCALAILRYGHIYGPGEESYVKLIPTAIRALLHGESPILYGDGSALRDFLYVDDAVEATVRAATLDVRRVGPVNIVRGRSTPVREVVEILARLSGYSGEICYLRDKPGGRSLRFSSERMSQTLGRWQTVSLEEGLRRELAYFKELSNRSAGPA